MSENFSYRFSLNSPIIPAKSLAGMIIGEKIIQDDFQRILGNLKEKHYRLDSSFTAHYKIQDGAIEIGVDVRNGKIYFLSASQGYTGKLFDKIVVGMKVSEAMKLVPSLYYSEMEEVLLCKDVMGLTLDIGEIDPPPEIVPDMDIVAINVFAPQTLTHRGHRGFWDIMMEEENKKIE